MRTRAVAKRALSLPSAPVRKLIVRHVALASMSSAGIDRLQGRAAVGDDRPWQPERSSAQRRGHNLAFAVCTPPKPAAGCEVLAATTHSDHHRHPPARKLRAPRPHDTIDRRAQSRCIGRVLLHPFRIARAWRLSALHRAQRRRVCLCVDPAELEGSGRGADRRPGEPPRAPPLCQRPVRLGSRVHRAAELDPRPARDIHGSAGSERSRDFGSSRRGRSRTDHGVREARLRTQLAPPDRRAPQARRAGHLRFTDGAAFDVQGRRRHNLGSGPGHCGLRGCSQTDQRSYRGGPQFAMHRDAGSSTSHRRFRSKIGSFTTTYTRRPPAPAGSAFI